MARVKIEGILDRLDREVALALEDILRSRFPDSHINYSTLTREFVQAMYRRCSVWERVPDKYVEMRD